MTDPDLPTHVAELLDHRVLDFESLEVLVLLFAERGAWKASDLGKRLLLDRDRVEGALEALRAAGLSAPDGDGASRVWTYAPSDAPSADAVAELAAAYRFRRIDVMRRITANALTRIRASARSTFGAPAARPTKKSG